MKGTIEREALRSWLMTPLVMLLGVFVAVRAIDAVLYDYYMREGRYVRAFLIRPLHFLRRAL